MAAKPLIQQFQDDLNGILNKYREQGMTVGEAVGAIEIVKLNLWSEEFDEEGEQQWEDS